MKKYFNEKERLDARRESKRKYCKNHKKKRKQTLVKYYQNHKEKIKKYYQNNKEKILRKRKIYRDNNKEIIKVKNKIYYEKNKEKVNKRNKIYMKNLPKKQREMYQENYKLNRNKQTNHRRKTNINFKISCYLRSRLNKAIKGNYKSGSAVRDLGCSISELKTHLESKFQEGMSWSNWSRTGWHIDHIIPLDSINLQNREEFLKAIHYTNLQPLWAEENIIKNNKIVKD